MILFTSKHFFSVACSAVAITGLTARGFQISISHKGNPRDNAQAESFMARLKKEEVYLNEYRTVEEARHKIGHFLE